MEYLEAHGKDAVSILEKVKKIEDDSGVEEGNDDENENESTSKETSAANADISDLEVTISFLVVFMIAFC